MTLWEKTAFVFIAIAISLPARAEDRNDTPHRSTAPVLRQILIADSVEAAKTLTPVPGGGFVVLSPTLSFLNSAELTKRLAAGENQVVQDGLLVGIVRVIETAVRQQDFPIATAVIPPQNIGDGTLRVAVQLGKFREIRFQGNRWFSESLLRETLHVEKGSIVRLSDLDRAITWTNNSPFRRIRAHIDPIPNSDEANLIIGVQEKLPLRFQTTFDNGGNEVLGVNRYSAGLTYGNAWGRDHQVSYQFLTTDEWKIYRGHVFDYRIPLSWHHYLQLSGSYLKARPEFYEGLFVQDGENLAAELRYTAPLRTGDNPVEAYAALRFKQSNNNLEFGGTEVLSSKADTFQFVTGLSMVKRDKRGAWVFGGSVTVSPGEINSRNTDVVYRDVRFDADATYAYGNLSVQRLLTLSHGWELNSRAALQISSGNLLANEQLSIGGVSTVRGFRENTFVGDRGFVFSNDLLFPTWKKPLPFLQKTRPPLETRFLLFFDAADVGVEEKSSRDRTFSALASTGVGVRATLPMNFSLSADYGWQITHLDDDDDARSRGHVRLVLAF